MSMGTRSTGTGRRTNLAIVTAMVLLLTAMAVLPAPSGAIPSGPPKLILTLSPASKEVVVSPSLQGSVAFCGTVRLENAIGSVQITLTSSVDNGWASNCAPGSIQIAGGADSNTSFAVTVVVPQATPSNIVGTVKVDARAQGPGYTLTESAQSVVTVKPYYIFKLNCTGSYQIIKPSYEATFDVKVFNEGNAVDSYELEIVNQKDLEAKGWAVTLSSVQISGVQPGQFSSTFRVSAKSPKENSLMTSEPTMINLRATSTSAKAEGKVLTQSFPLYAHVKGSYIGAPGVAEALPIVAIAVVLLVCVAVAIAFIAKRRHSRGE